MEEDAKIAYQQELDALYKEVHDLQEQSIKLDRQYQQALQTYFTTSHERLDNYKAIEVKKRRISYLINTMPKINL